MNCELVPKFADFSRAYPLHQSQTMSLRFHRKFMFSESLLPSACIILSALCISLYINFRFFGYLLLPYAFCRALNGQINRSFIIVVMLFAMMATESLMLLTVIPSLWYSLQNAIHIFLTHCFLFHFALWWFIDFDIIIDKQSEHIEIGNYITLPALASLIISIVVSGFTQWPCSWLCCFLGFMAMWTSDQFVGSCRGRSNLYEFAFDTCSLFLLHLVPCVCFIWQFFVADAGYRFIWVEFLFLLSISRYLYGLLRCQIQFPNVLSPNSEQTLATLFSVIFGLLTLCDRADFGTLFYNLPYATLWILVQFILFIVILLLQSHFLITGDATKNGIWNGRQIVCLVCGFLLLGSNWLSLESLFLATQASVRHLQLLSSLPWSIFICLIGSIMSIVSYQRFEQHWFDAAISLAFAGFHTAEWQLYQALLLSELDLFRSAAVVCLGIFLLYITERDGFNRPKNRGIAHPSVDRTTNVVTWWLIGPLVLAPTFTKLTLVALTQRSFVNNNPDVHRLHFTKSTVLGIYLLCVAMSSGARLYRLGVDLAKHFRKMRFLRLPKSEYIGIAVVWLVFMFSLSLFWPTTIRPFLGANAQTDWTIISAITMVLSALSLYLPVGENGVGSDPDQRARWFLCEFGSFLLYSAFIQGRLLYANLRYLFELIMIPPLCGVLLWLTIRLVTFSSLPAEQRSFLRFRAKMDESGWIYTSVRSAMWLQVVLLTGLYRFYPELGVTKMAILFWTLIPYSISLSGLVMWNAFAHVDLLRPPPQRARRGQDRRLSKNTRILLDHSSCTGNSQTLPDGCMDDQNLYVFDRDMFTRAVLRVKCALLTFGAVSIILSLYLALRENLDDLLTDNNYSCSLFSASALAVFSLSQFALGHLFSVPMHATTMPSTPSRKSSMISLPTRTTEQYVFSALVNTTVLSAPVLILLGCSWSYSDMELLLLPWCLFGLTGQWFGQFRSCLVWLAFTLLMLCSLFTQSQLLHGLSDAPLVSSRAGTLLSLSNYQWLWMELLLIIFLIPMHTLFLLDQANLSSTTIVSFFLLPLRPFEKRHVAYRNVLAEYLSILFAHIFYLNYILFLLCVAFMFVASSFISATYGLYSLGVCTYLLVRVKIVH